METIPDDLHSAAIIVRITWAFSFALFTHVFDKAIDLGPSDLHSFERI